MIKSVDFEAKLSGQIQVLPTLKLLFILQDSNMTSSSKCSLTPSPPMSATSLLLMLMICLLVNFPILPSLSLFNLSLICGVLINKWV